MVNDLDGGEAAHTVPFALDGVTYEIDLSDENAVALREELARYIGSARRTGGRKVRLATGQSITAPTNADREKNRQVRTWAQDNGYEVSSRGRLSVEILDAYTAAQQASAEPEPAPEPVKPARKRASRKQAAGK